MVISENAVCFRRFTVGTDKHGFHITIDLFMPDKLHPQVAQALQFLFVVNKVAQAVDGFLLLKFIFCNLYCTVNARTKSGGTVNLNYGNCRIHAAKVSNENGTSTGC